MLVLVNAVNDGKPLGSATLDEVRALGAHGIRTDVLPGGVFGQLEEFLVNPDLQLLALVHGGDMPGDAGVMLAEATRAATVAFEELRMGSLPRPPIFELGNEPTVSWKRRRWPPDTFGQAVAAAARRIWEIAGTETLVISGGIHNPDRERQDYLRRTARHFPPPGEGAFAIGFHDYAPGMGDPDEPHRGFRTRDEQVARLREHGHALFDTESGGHTGPGGHSEEQVAGWLTRRLDQSLAWDLLGSVVYQLNDGPDPEQFEHHFGLLRLHDRSWKPSAAALRRWIDDHATARPG